MNLRLFCGSLLRGRLTRLVFLLHFPARKGFQMRGEFLADMLRGPNDTAAVDRMTKRVAGLLNFPEPLVRQYGARFDSFTYRREANRASGRVASIYDSSVRSFDPEPTAYYPTSNADPFTGAYAAPMQGAVAELYA